MKKKPQKDSSDQKSFHVHPSDTKNSTTDHHNITSVRLGIEISNPNKGMSIYYSDIYFTMNHNGIVVAKNSTPGFYQPCKNDTTRAVEMKLADLQFLQQIIGGNVSFKIGLETTVQYRIFKWKTKHHKMDYEAYVYNVTVNGTDLGQNGTVLKKTVF
ncbi:PREDICTED: protein NDR1-like isoform X2 [Ipomoea nil]|uniref:protein NDR1-like isoform X2 n=1 Tax=Ipomoea nil TaxID=35883 RepID=UPI0009014C24|nr:PREDICTED: protein NDR1-like isoform X2 [Ipomoea nil]